MPNIRKLIILALSIAAHCWGHTGATAEVNPTAEQANVVYIFMDDQRYNTIKALGQEDIITPNLDRLAARSFIFSNAYCFGGNTAAVCIPARNMNMTGNTFFHFNGGNTSGNNPRDNGKGYTFPKSMKAAGYETYNREKSGSANLPHIRTQFDYYGDINMVQEQRTGYAARSIINDAIEYLEKDRDTSKPFFMYLGIPGPHDPRLSAQEFHDMYDREKIPLPENYLPSHPWDIGKSTMLARDEMIEAWPRAEEAIRGHIEDYFAIITSMDVDIGRLLDKLDQMNLTKETLIIFSSDQGLAIGSHGLMGKQSLYDDVMKVPMMFAGPGIPQGSSDALMFIHDVYPTVCELTGAPIPQGIDGISMVPVIEGKVDTLREQLMFAYQRNQRAIRDERWKLIQFTEINKTLLFDLKKDPWETNNLADAPEYKEVVERMLNELKSEQAYYGDDQLLFAENPRDSYFKLPTQEDIRNLRKAKRERRSKDDDNDG